MNDNGDLPEPPPIGAIVGAVELLAQRVHVLERALIGMAALATPEQRHAIQAMIDHAAASYSPAFRLWPQVEPINRLMLKQIAANYQAMFSA